MSYKTHGESETRLYKKWQEMKHRCNCKSDKHHYKYYISRGIKVCDEWQTFLPFREWALSNGYSDNLSIDRIDPDGNYSPDNCRWIPFKEQSSNTRKNVFLTYNGETKTVAQWAKIIGVKPNTVYRRIRLGWSTEDIIEKETFHGRMITYDGRTMNMKSWSEETGIPLQTIFNRYIAGWEPQKILSVESKKGNNQFTTKQESSSLS